MAETLGTLCDKLTIVKLKQFHSQDPLQIENLTVQEKNLCGEIDEFVTDAVAGKINPERLTFASNKVYKKEGNELNPIQGSLGEIFAELAKVNCDLWHEQEKVYEFEQVPADEKNNVVKKLAILNLKRNQCMDLIDKQFKTIVLEYVQRNR